jgi:ssDNA-binding Zn-finger/Zn-ribbon topoisomerase 1
MRFIIREDGDMSQQTTPEITKACPDCGRRLVIRTNRDNGSQFIGCTGYPECNHTEGIPETLKMRLAGAPELPMFDDTSSPVAEVKQCRSCGADVVWGYTVNGKRCPFNVDETGRPTQQSHFETCPQARSWSK